MDDFVHVVMYSQYITIQALVRIPQTIINARRMHAHKGYSTHIVCVFCVLNFILSLYDKMIPPAWFLLLFLAIAFQLAEFDINLSIERYRSFTLICTIYSGDYNTM